MDEFDKSAVFPSGEASRALGQVTDCLRPATFDCPDCGTTRVIASAMPPGDCPDCGAPYRIHQV